MTDNPPRYDPRFVFHVAKLKVPQGTLLSVALIEIKNVWAILKIAYCLGLILCNDKITNEPD